MTIVQEMENRRNSVIVIFAGYPDKMKQFLERNEGLRSRIVFQMETMKLNAEQAVSAIKVSETDKAILLKRL